MGTTCKAMHIKRYVLNGHNAQRLGGNHSKDTIIIRERHT